MPENKPVTAPCLYPVMKPGQGGLRRKTQPRKGYGQKEKKMETVDFLNPITKGIGGGGCKRKNISLLQGWKLLCYDE